MRVIARQISTFRRDIFRQRVHVTYFVIARFNNDRQFHFPYRLLPIEIRERSILSLNARVPFVQRARKLHKSRTRVRENKPQLCSNALPLLRLLFTEIRDARTNYANTFARNYRLLERSAVSKNNGRCSATFGHRAKHPLHAQRALVSACRVYVRTRFPSFSKDNTVIFEKLDWNLRGQAAILCRIFNTPAFLASKPIPTLNIEERGTWRSL